MTIIVVHSQLDSLITKITINNQSHKIVPKELVQGHKTCTVIKEKNWIHYFSIQRNNFDTNAEISGSLQLKPFLYSWCPWKVTKPPVATKWSFSHVANGTVLYSDISLNFLSSLVPFKTTINLSRNPESIFRLSSPSVFLCSIQSWRHRDWMYRSRPFSGPFGPKKAASAVLDGEVHAFTLDQ